MDYFRVKTATVYYRDGDTESFTLGSQGVSLIVPSGESLTIRFDDGAILKFYGVDFSVSGKTE